MVEVLKKDLEGSSSVKAEPFSDLKLMLLLILVPPNKQTKPNTTAWYSYRTGEHTLYVIFKFGLHNTGNDEQGLHSGLQTIMYTHPPSRASQAALPNNLTISRSSYSFGYGSATW